MTEKEFERLFIESSELEPRAELKKEVLDRAKKEMEQKSIAKKPKAPIFKRLKVWIPVAACLALAILVLGGVLVLQNENYQTVYIDVNPSVALNLNRFENVVGTDYLNDDAKAALENVSLEGKSAEEALEVVIECYDKLGYFDTEAQLYISTDEGAEELLEKLKSHAEKIKGNKKYTVNSSALSKEEKEEAKESGISPGKYRIITEIIELAPQYTFEELKNLSMSKLNEILKGLTKPNKKGS